MTTQHTPAPWGFDAVTGTVYYDDEAQVCPTVAVVDLDNVTDPAQGEADGALIAAAPAMLAALERIIAADPELRTFQRIIDATGQHLAGHIRAAIAQARGTPTDGPAHPIPAAQSVEG